jgi:hypothetical protein
MNWKRRSTVALAALLGSKQATATTSGVVTAVAFIPVVEHAAPWVLGLMGSAIVHAHFPPRSSAMAVSNGIISVVLGGLGGPVVVGLLGHYLGISTGIKAMLLASFVLAAAWPWVAPSLWDGVKGMWSGFVTGFAKRQGGDDGRA